MIRKRSQKNFATATPATFATHAQFNPPTVARVATVAVANTEQGQSAQPSVSFVSSFLPTIEKITPSKNDDVFRAEIAVDRNTSSQDCRDCIHFSLPGLSNGYCAGRDDLPPAYGLNHPLRKLPDDDGKSCGKFQSTAEPIADMPAKTLSSFCHEAAVDRNSSILPTIADADDRRTCQQCLNLRGRVCSIAKPERGALVVANVGYRPQPDTLHRCAGYLPNATDNDQRPGGERWPGLTNTKGTK